MPIASDTALKERDWEEPLDESPVDTPDGWNGGSIVHTGGNVYCRIWTTKTETQSDTTDPEPDVYYEAVYGQEFDGAVIDVYEYREDSDLWERRGELDRKLCSDETDLDCAEVALELMKEHSPPATNADHQMAPDDLSWEDLTGTYEGATVTVTAGQFLQAYFELAINGHSYVARVPIDRDQLEDGLDSGEYTDTDIAVSANDWAATHDPSNYENRDDDWKRRIHCLFKLGDTAIEAALDEVCHEAKDGEQVWAAWTTEAQPTAAQVETNTTESSAVNNDSE